MKPECMPGMVMPGCATAVPPSRAQSGPPVIELALIVVVVLSTYVLVIFVWRHFQRGQIASYQALPDLVGHVAHALGMIGMALLMIGTLTTIGPLLAYVIGYGLFALLFGVRLVVRWSSCDRRRESWHWFINASMAYMFSATSVPLVTIACLLTYLYFIVVAARGSRPPLEPPRDGPREHPALRALDAHGDITIAISMVLMLSLTQWPQWFS
ncbi:MAG TPA: DUF5134 domain-containing protein [Candidatus Dormibacteraeota bacterium]